MGGQVVDLESEGDTSVGLETLESAGGPGGGALSGVPGSLYRILQDFGVVIV